MKDSASLKLEVSNFSLHLLDFDVDRSGGNAFWLGVTLCETGIKFSAIVCFPFFLVRSQALLNVGSGGLFVSLVFGFGLGVFFILPGCIVLTCLWVCG